MTDLETLIVFVLGFLPAVIFWILLISYVTNKIFDAIERDKQLMDEYTFDCYGYAHKKDEINDCSCKDEIAINDLSFPPTTFEELRIWEESGLLDDILKRQEKLKEIEERNSDFEVAKFNYVEDKLNDYLNTDEATNKFTDIFKEEISHEWKKNIWLAHLDEKRHEYKKDFDNL